MAIWVLAQSVLVIWMATLMWHLPSCWRPLHHSSKSNFCYSLLRSPLLTSVSQLSEWCPIVLTTCGSKLSTTQVYVKLIWNNSCLLFWFVWLFHCHEKFSSVWLVTSSSVKPCTCTVMYRVNCSITWCSHFVVLKLRPATYMLWLCAPQVMSQPLSSNKFFAAVQ